MPIYLNYSESHNRMFETFSGNQKERFHPSDPGNVWKSTRLSRTLLCKLMFVVFFSFILLHNQTYKLFFYKLKTNCFYFEKAVTFSTFNNDPATLKAILDWGSIKNIKTPSEDEKEQCPILVASLENYAKCTDLLYKFGYRIQLDNNDGAGIKEMLTGNSVERFLRFKAYANPLYIATAFLNQRGLITEPSKQIGWYAEYNTIKNIYHLHLVICMYINNMNSRIVKLNFIIINNVKNIFYFVKWNIFPL